MVVTFARAAARDLITAASEVAGADGKILPSTLHSFCFSLLSRDEVLNAVGRTHASSSAASRICSSRISPDFGGKKAREATLEAFLAAWARLQSDEPGEPVEGLDQRF